MKRTLLIVASAGIAIAAAPCENVAGAQAQSPMPPAVIAQGKEIFEGRQGGALCSICHGVDARGVPGLAPNLTDSTWLHGDGSMAFLQKLIAAGVPQPKEAAIVMPAMGGANLNAEQVRALAAYVSSLSKK